MTGQDLLFYAAPGLPIACCMLALLPRARKWLIHLLPVAPLPGLAAALLLPAGQAIPLPRTLLGAGLELTETGRVFLGAAALLWTLAGLYARAAIRDEGRDRFAGFWLATLSGNMLLLVAADMVSFYLGFAMLSLAAFGLVVHDHGAEARRAARIYLLLAVLGETMLLLGLLVAAEAAQSILIADAREALASAPRRDLALGLLVAGFGLKAGLMPLHVWLPLAHPAAPVPASAILSGAIVKAGIFGLMAFLPLEADLADWRAILIALGFATAYLGAGLGIVQHRPKTVLAYSTLSQMGLVIALLGAGLGSPGAGLVLAAATLYCAHHSLAKGALFLSVGAVANSQGHLRAAAITAAATAALAIAGLPFTGGALAKLAIKTPIEDGMIAMLVTASAVGTTLLMLRFLQLLVRSRPADKGPPAGLWVPPILCVAAALTLPWLLFPQLTELNRDHALLPSSLRDAVWPLLLGTAMMAGLLSMPRHLAPRVPEGDLIVPLERASRLAWTGTRRLAHIRLPRIALPSFPRLDGLERALARWSVAGPGLLLAAGLAALSGLA